MTEGDSKAPSASMAASICRKAGARGKHTRNIVTTPGNARGEEKSLEQDQSTVPKNGWARKTLPPMPATASAEAGQPQSWKRNNPMGRPLPAPFPTSPEC